MDEDHDIARPLAGQYHVSKTCFHCGVSFSAHRYRAASSRFCSRACQDESRRGVPRGQPGTPRAFTTRFWSRVERVYDQDSCWLWIGPLEASGYARFWLDGKHQSAHRLSYELARGPIPQHSVVMHTCDNRACVRPEHLRAGTHRENTEDAIRKGRHAHGEKTPVSKLNDDSVRVIRASSLGCWKLAIAFGVSATTIREIRAGVTWKHLLP